MKKGLLWLSLLAAVTAFLYWQNFSLQRENCILSSSQLPEAFQNFRIVQLSDLHGRIFGTEQEALLKAVAKSRPDIICITGDLFDEKTDLSTLPVLLTGLAQIAPTYYVTGNHEWQVDGLSEILAQMEVLGVCVLENEYVLLEREGQSLVLGGVHDPCGPYDQKTPAELVTEIRQKEGENTCILMLSHRNDTLELWAELGVELVLAGHCHGGVVRLPWAGGLIGSGRQLFPQYDAGAYTKEATTLYVSRGLGDFRLFNRPHLPLLILQS